ncbi:MAG: helix-hairpin-helix domain-containing protein [Bacilli bacterium]
MEYVKKYKFVILFIILVVIIFGGYKLLNKEEVVIDEIKDKVIKEDKIKIDIKGAVNKPGVYEINNHSRVSDAINISGGLTSIADTQTINLSKVLTDEMVIVIYTIDEIKEMKQGSTSIKYIDNICNCPKIENDACPNQVITNIPDALEDENKETDNNQTDNKVSLNKATLEQLMTLTGIGEAKAKLIIEYRTKNGGFKKIEELMEVKGIGIKTYEKFKERLTL